MEILGYVASEEDFFDKPCCINCEVEKYCAFPGADKAFGVNRVYEKSLIDIGEGILISKPVIVGKGLREKGFYFYASLSHQGILAVHSRDEKFVTQFTDLINEEQVEVEVEQSSNVAFYDDKMILLTWRKPLREAGVGVVFDKHDISVFERIGDVDGVYPYTDTSLLHSRRILCYTSADYIPYEYNVDTRENKEMEIGQKVWVFSSLMGIDCGVKAVFQDEDNNTFTSILGWDNKITSFYEVREDWSLRSLFASSAHPKDLSKSILRYENYLIKEGHKIDPREPIWFEFYYSVVRVYRDIFLLCDKKTHKWVLSRIIIH